MLSEEGEQLGIVNTAYAQKKASTLGLDLVEISPQARPPVCKIMNYGKFKYQQKRKASIIKKKQLHSELKEIKFRPKTDIHDFNVKINKLKKFLNHGNKGKVTMMFRGRELVHTNIGKEILARVAEDLKNISVIESKAKMEGRQMVMILAPQKKST